MDKEFTPYEQAFALKELGFDESCFAHLIGFGDGTLENGRYVINHQQVFYPNDHITPDDKAEELGLHPFVICGVPLYQQAFRWFREKYKLNSTITSISQESWQWHITKPDESLGKLYDEDFYTYEEAELECLKKLIEIIKENN